MSQFRRDRFNGATAMKPWKSGRPTSRGIKEAELQWGHGDEAVEEIDLTVGRAADPAASMGPRR